jgi:hypothetical protein
MKLQAEAMIDQKVEKEVFNPQAIEKQQLELQRRNTAVAEKNAETSRINALKPDGGEGEDEGPAWKNYVEEGVPVITSGPNSDEDAIAVLNNKFRGLGLTFKNAGKGKEGIIITDIEATYPEPYKVILQGNPNARQEIINYILQNKAGKAKSLIATDVIKKKSNQTTGEQKSNDPLGLR